MSAPSRVLPQPSFTPWKWLQGLRGHWRARPEKRLWLRESLSLGERRFLALVECGPQKFLIGGTSNSVCLLAELRPPEPDVEVWP
jgi:flagellar biogenesis protein FliO